VRLFDRTRGTNEVLENLPLNTRAGQCRLSPNAKMFAFLTVAPGNLWDVQVRDVGGGPVHTIARLDGVGLDWAPDSETLVMTTPSDEGGPLCVWAMRHMLRDKQRVSRPPAGSWGDIDVAASPDGVHLAVIRYAARGDGDIWLLSWDGRVERQLTKHHTWINGLTFTPDGREIVYAPVDRHAPSLHRIAITGGAPTAIPTPGVEGLTNPKCGLRVLVFSSTRLLSRIYRARREGDSVADVRLAIPINAEGEYIAFSHHSMGWIQNDGIWVSSNGDAPRLITQVPRDKRELVWAPDGRHIAVTIQTNQQWRIWIVDVETGAMKRLTADEATEGRAIWSNSGTYIYWRTERAGDPRFFRMPWPQGGVPEPVSGRATMGIPSGDDNCFYYLDNDQRSTLKGVDIGRTKPPRSLAHIPPIEPGHFLIRGESIIYTVRQASSEKMPIYRADLAGGSSQFLFAVPESPDHVTQLAIRPDLTEVAWCRRDEQDDIWIYEGFQ
jgi:Tol biopolymer transport system component